MRTQSCACSTVTASRRPGPSKRHHFGCVVRDYNGQAFAHVYCDDNPTAQLLTREEARHIATKVATLPELFHRGQVDQIECFISDRGLP
jgi:hypothetical protein